MEAKMTNRLKRLFGEEEDEDEQQEEENYSNHQDEEEQRQREESNQSSPSSASQSSSSTSSGAAGAAESSSSSSGSSSSNRSRSSGSGSVSGSGSEREADEDGTVEVISHSNNDYNSSGYHQNEEDDDDYKDLFGSDNEDYAKTLSKSRFPVSERWLNFCKGEVTRNPHIRRSQPKHNTRRQKQEKMFYETLVLKNCGLVNVNQNVPYGYITLKVTSRLKEQLST